LNSLWSWIFWKSTWTTPIKLKSCQFKEAWRKKFRIMRILQALSLLTTMNTLLMKIMIDHCCIKNMKMWSRQFTIWRILNLSFSRINWSSFALKKRHRRGSPILLRNYLGRSSLKSCMKVSRNRYWPKRTRSSRPVGSSRICDMRRSRSKDCPISRSKLMIVSKNKRRSRVF